MTTQHNATARFTGFASMHAKVIRADGTIEWRRSVQRPHPWWNLRLWVLWFKKHAEYNERERRES